MSSEQVINNKSLETSNSIKAEFNKNDDKLPCRVDINKLLSRVRENEKKRTKKNLIFLSFISSVLVITGVIASL